MFATLGVATIALVLVTWLPLWRHPHWIIRGMEFPRLQFAVLAAVLLLAQLILLDLAYGGTWAILVPTLFCLAWQLWWIVPYTFLWPVEVQAAGKSGSDRHLSILTANVLTPNRDAEAFLALVREHRPDVLVTLESDQWWQDHLDTLQPDMPHSMKCPLDNLYGMHVYSRLPFDQPETQFLVENDVPSMHALLRLRTGESVRVHFLHPAPPSPTENPESSERDAELVMIGRSVAGSDRPVIVAGDLNDVAWSATTRLFRKLSGLLDPRVGRGMFNTFHADHPLIRWPLDHIFHSRDFRLRSIRRLPPFGSDHFALLTELSYTPRRGAAQEGLEADSSDRKQAESIVREQNVSRADVPRPGEPVP
jgi:endonuclease/exonuclease/phosphatase (EEP) superfamily protein YafD